MPHLATYTSSHALFIKRFVFIISFIPAALLLYKYQSNNLGINPFNTLMHNTGYWALTFLLITLAITPARRLLTQLMIIINSSHGKRISDWNILIKIRRTLGMYVFFYACLHLSVYLYLDMDMDFEEILWDIEERPFITAGMTSFALLIPLALTSTNYMMRRLKNNWRRIHRLIYPLSIIAIIHYWWLSKVGVYTPMPYTLILMSLLGYRLVVWVGIRRFKPKDDGMEVPER